MGIDFVFVDKDNEIVNYYPLGWLARLYNKQFCQEYNQDNIDIIIEYCLDYILDNIYNLSNR